MSNPSKLRPGDRIEIRYLRGVARTEEAKGCHRWIGAEIQRVDQDAWPLAKLSDGQFTEVRRYMEWRYC